MKNLIPFFLCGLCLMASNAAANQQNDVKAAQNETQKETAKDKKKSKAPQGEPHTVKVMKELMGTKIILMAHGRDRDFIQEQFEHCFAEIKRLEKLFSLYHSSSQILAINEQAGKAPVKLRPEVFEVLSIGKQVSNSTDGAFDITYAGLKEVWDFSKNKSTTIIPSPAAVEAVLPRVDHSKLELDPEKQTAFLQAKNMSIGVGGIVKGYTADRLSAMLRSAGINDALIYVGGDIVVLGTKGSVPWVVGIQDPRSPGYFATIALKDMAVVTSGDYERYFEMSGKRYHHIIDPKTGFPAEGVRSVTVVAPSGAKADALATAIFVMGVKAGLEYAEAHKEIEVVIVDHKNNVIISPGLEKKIVVQRAPTP